MTNQSNPTFNRLSRRERQVMEILYSRGRATATEIHDALADPPTFSATRAVIRTLEEKSQIRHEEEGLRFVYSPVVPLEKARRSALTHLVTTFFEGSPSQLMATMLDESSRSISAEELKALDELIQKAKERAR